MGGTAFLQAAAEGQLTLRTPRMSPELYERLKATYLERLRAYFPTGTIVIALKEAPGKADYGDLDIIASSDKPLDPLDLANAIGAAGVIFDGTAKAHRCILGVPRDGRRDDKSAIKYKNTKRKSTAELTEEEYAQIDVELIPPDLFKWHTFYASYGDMAGLLGQICHNLGFTVSDKGFILRLKELDDGKWTEYIRVADKEGMLFLSNDPDQVMSFLGLSPKDYDAGFHSMDAFYAWLAECRLLTDDYLQYKRRNTSNQRQKEKKRTIITAFFDEYLPEHRGIGDTGEVSDPVARRHRWQQGAVEFFQKRDEFETLQGALVTSIENQTADYLLKPIIKTHSGCSDKKLNEIVRAFRRWISFSDETPYILEKPHSDVESELRVWLAEEDKQSLRDIAAINEFVQQNWEEIKVLERQRGKSNPGPFECSTADPAD